MKNIYSIDKIKNICYLKIKAENTTRFYYFKLNGKK
jgi:hypothetical protein